MRPILALRPLAAPRSPHPVRAAHSSGARGSRLGAVPSLEQFLHRARALALYRTILRGTRRIGDGGARAEARRFARGEFESRRAVTDLAHGRYLLSTGKTEWEKMERFIDGL